jgi:uncharacterized membrane protein YqgA involved in biofilm formation
MLGVLVNTFAIIGCSLIGLLFKKLMSDRIETVLMQALGICVFVVGTIDAINPVKGTEGILVMIISFVIGGFIGSLLNIEKGFTKLGEGFEKLFNKAFSKDSSSENKGKFAEGFIQATMIYCIGAMVIYGSIQAGLGDNKILYIKAVLDGTLAIILTVKYGIGVAFASIPVFVIQGAIALSSGLIGEFLMMQTAFRGELSAIGGVFVMMIGLNLLEIKKMNVANMLPAILGACYFLSF